MSGHTPGPWDVVEATEHHGFYVISEFGNTIADLYTMSNPDMIATANGGLSKPVPFMHEMDGPNARLIAAAPELLDLLAEADRRIAWESVGLTNTFSDRVEAALAKARGESLPAGSEA
ncbi:hypothetical protein [Novosphingobium sp. PY1]|uniref:Uncharacterized protein n=1 Tax=Ochrobactrum sp. PW1 TaxID=1882222 RepID=A0A292GNE5_9HYPH|nr:hypothetical protein [Novosphingobium sp. PY1]BBA74388.1 hypothetical protein [Ochrobactrum sp. PW1]GFM29237.1 uncharacterized protein PY1_contig-07-163 [Novosphingobium sp. PY1]